MKKNYIYLYVCIFWCMSAYALNAQVTATITHASAGQLGAISLQINGGTPPYTIKWTSKKDIKGQGIVVTNLPQFDDKENIDGLEPSEYCVVITDDKCCSAEQCFMIYSCLGWDDLQPQKINVTNESAGGMNDGSISLDMPLTPANSYYSFTWYKDFSIPLSILSNYELKNLSAGRYLVEIEDLKCPINKTTKAIDVGLDNCNSLSITSEVKNDCTGLGGSINIYTIGAVNLAYVKWQWKDSNDNTPFRYNLKPGVYSVIITDEITSCTATESITINQGFQLTVQGNSNMCLDSSTPSIPNIVEGSTSSCIGCKYQWGLLGQNSSSTIFPSLPGMYLVTVTSQYGCTLSKDYEFVDLTTEYVKPCVSLTGANVLGSYGFKSSSGYAIKWDDGSINKNHVIGVGQSLSYTLTGSSGCVFSNSVTLPVLNGDDIKADYNPCSPNPFKVTALGVNFPVKIDFNNETRFISSQGQVLSYNLSNSTGLQKLQFTDVTRGCTVTKDIDFTKSFFIFIENLTEGCKAPSSTQLRVVIDTQAGVSNGEIFTYKWSNGDSGRTISALINEYYTVTVTSQAGCTVTASYNNTAANYPTTAFNPFGGYKIKDDCGTGDGQIFIQSSLHYTYKWDNKVVGNINDKIAGNKSYTVTATNINSDCGSFTKKFYVNNIKEFKPTSYSECFHQGNGSLVFEGLGEATQIIWENGTTNTGIYNLSAGSYCYKVFIPDIAGCSMSSCALVESNQQGDFPPPNPCGEIYCGDKLLSNELDNNIRIVIDMCYYDQQWGGQVEGAIHLKTISDVRVSFQLVGQDGTNEQGDLSQPYDKTLKTGKYSLYYYDEEHPECIHQYDFEVNCCKNNVSDKLIISQNVTAATKGNNGSINIKTSVPISNANIKWTGANGFTAIGLGINNLEPGEYCLDIRYLCNSERQCFTVGSPATCQEVFKDITTSSTPSCDCSCSDKEIQGSITVKGINTSTTSFSWAEGLGYGYNGVFEGLQSGTYTLFLSSNALGCKKTIPITVGVADTKLVSRNGCKLKFKCGGKTTYKTLSETYKSTDNPYSCDYITECSDGETFTVKESDPSWNVKCMDGVCFATAKCAKFNIGIFGQLKSEDVYGIDNKKCGTIDNTFARGKVYKKSKYVNIRA